MATITLNPPLIITSRLLPGVRVDDLQISIEPTGRSGKHNKPQWRYYLDFIGDEHIESHVDDDLHGHGDHRKMLASLLSFMSACGEGIAYQERKGRQSENADLFPPHIGQWCRLHTDELSLIGMELDEQEQEQE